MERGRERWMGGGFGGETEQKKKRTQKKASMTGRKRREEPGVPSQILPSPTHSLNRHGSSSPSLPFSFLSQIRISENHTVSPSHPKCGRSSCGLELDTEHRQVGCVERQLAPPCPDLLQSVITHPTPVAITLLYSSRLSHCAQDYTHAGRAVASSRLGDMSSVLRGAAVCQWCCTNRMTHGGHHCSLDVLSQQQMASTLLSPMVDYYNDEEELDSVDEDDDRSFRGRDSEEDTEDASETDLAKHDEEDYVEIKEQMYQDKLASLKRQLQQLQEGTLQEYQKRMKKLDQQYKERLRNADLFLQLETEQVERNYIKEKKAAVKEFDDKKVELKENLIAELEEKKKMIENEKLTMELTGDSMEVKPIMTRKLRRRPNDPVPIPDKRRKPAPDILYDLTLPYLIHIFTSLPIQPSSLRLNYLLTDDQIMEDLRTLNKLKSPKRPASPSSPEHLPAAPMESPSQRYEARIEDGKLYYDKR
ncbi:hypothetical protein NFI96_019481 [Prochilodus magdalenae]|nr:hypothetical protein NFI96_019481 [Prochilodus magdalenae]